MNATFPPWVTILIAVLSPAMVLVGALLTLLGVRLTQRAADRRADREAELRVFYERRATESGRLFILYQEINRASRSMAEQDETTPEPERKAALDRFDEAMFEAHMFAPSSISEAALDFRNASNQYY